MSRNNHSGGAMGGDGHFFHDMIEGIIIWEDSDQPGDTPIQTPIEATEDTFDHGVDASGLDANHGYAVHDATSDDVVAHDPSLDGPIEG